MKAWLEKHAPWLVMEFNGVEWENQLTHIIRRYRAMEASLQSAHLRINDLEERLRYHSQGAKHRKPKDKLPEADHE